MKTRSRRGFLTVTGVVSAGIIVGSRRLSASASRNSPRVRFGVRSPFRQKSLRERAVLLQRLGYQGIELGPEYLNRPPRSILADLQGTDIVVSAIVGSLKLLDPNSVERTLAVELDRKRLEMARILGAVAVIEVPTFGSCRFPEEAKEPPPHILEDRLLVEGLRHLTSDAERTGVNILLEPLTRKETHYMNLQSHGARIIEEVGTPDVRLLSDFFHMQMEEKDIAATLGKYGKYTGYVHLADGIKRTEPGSLPFDYRPGFKALKKWGFSGWLTIESGATDDPEAALGRALPYLQQQWREA
jgi:sugar phosphate isomerase/epimerase